MLTTGSENSIEDCGHSQKPTSKDEADHANSKKKGVIYEIPCKDSPCVYIGERGRTLEKPWRLPHASVNIYFAMHSLSQLAPLKPPAQSHVQVPTSSTPSF